MPFSDHLLCHATMQHCLLMCPLLQRCNLDTSSIRGAKLSVVVPQLEQQSIESLEAISQRLACAAFAVALQEFVFVPLLCELLVPRYPATQDIDLRPSAILVGLAAGLDLAVTCNACCHKQNVNRHGQHP